MKMLEWMANREGLSFVPQLRREPERRADDQVQYALSFATSPGEVAEAQRLRYKVFAEEMGARLENAGDGLDRDVFDGFCEHLLVRQCDTGRVVGAYRLLPPEAARRIGRFYSESEFDLDRLSHLRDSTVEAGRSCVHWEHRNGPVIMLLWAGIARFMKRYGYQHLIGCASVSLRDGGHTAANLYRSFGEAQFVSPEYRVFPRLALPVETLATGEAAVAPPLLKGYLRAGARVGGAPAWDPDFNTADFFMLLNLAQLNPRYARHFG
ncbi:MAG: GNAT family N-acetyltransferase [Burkholderiales bacterium]|nr:GNAT family N-acetyltransferase [Burkholderiales bacterium]